MGNEPGADVDEPGADVDKSVDEEPGADVGKPGADIDALPVGDLQRQAIIQRFVKDVDFPPFHTATPETK